MNSFRYTLLTVLQEFHKTQFMEGQKSQTVGSNLTITSLIIKLLASHSAQFHCLDRESFVTFTSLPTHFLEDSTVQFVKPSEDGPVQMVRLNKPSDLSHVTVVLRSQCATTILEVQLFSSTTFKRSLNGNPDL